ncbi:uncharacterized protein LOC113060070 [Carassius auratus]|uniref:Uncharacterized protein LOC113060070 n=1 Tax=Carassius auratus TaxID=7957 RepID=A0A6P6LLZ5_CARAU|nr:uncharacterized protein LOC113060070 [Carassius auratus]
MKCEDDCLIDQSEFVLLVRLPVPALLNRLSLLQHINCKNISFKDVSVDLPRWGKHKHYLFVHLASGTSCNYGGLNRGAFLVEGAFPLKVDGLLKGQASPSHPSSGCRLQGFLSVHCHNASSLRDEFGHTALHLVASLGSVTCFSGSWTTNMQTCWRRTRSLGGPHCIAALYMDKSLPHGAHRGEAPVVLCKYHSVFLSQEVRLHLWAQRSPSAGTGTSTPIYC